MSKMESADLKNKVATICSIVTEKLPKKSKDKPTEENPENTKEKSNESEIEIDLPVCRICLEGSKKSGLISPCLCSGSCALVHLKCLRLWLATKTTSTTTRKTDECEICKSQYKLKTVTVNPHFRQYVRENPVAGAVIVCFVLLAGCILFQIALTVVIVMRAIDGQEDAGAFGISLLFFFTLAVCSVWIYTMIKANISKWREFKIQNQRVKFVPADPENTGNNHSNNKNAVSMETEIAANGEVESSQDFLVGQNTVIQMSDETSAALFNSDEANQSQNQYQLSSAFVNSGFEDKV